jgi:hypothetical protein
MTENNSIQNTLSNIEVQALVSDHNIEVKALVSGMAGISPTGPTRSISNSPTLELAINTIESSLCCDITSATETNGSNLEETQNFYLKFETNEPIRLRAPFCTSLQEGQKTNKGFHFGVKGTKYWYLPQDINKILPLKPDPDEFKIGTILVVNGFQPIQANVIELYNLVFEYFMKMVDLQWFSNQAMAAPFNPIILEALKSKCLVLPYWYRPHGRILKKGPLTFIRKLVPLLNLIVAPIVRKDLRYIKIFDHKNWQQNKPEKITGHMFSGFLKENVTEAVHAVLEQEDTVDKMAQFIRRVAEKLKTDFMEDGWESIKEMGKAIAEFFEMLKKQLCDMCSNLFEWMCDKALEAQAALSFFVTALISLAKIVATDSLESLECLAQMLSLWLGIDDDDDYEEGFHSSEELESSEEDETSDGLIIIDGQSKLENLLGKVIGNIFESFIDTGSKSLDKFLSKTTNMAGDLSVFFVKAFRNIMFLITKDSSWKYGKKKDKVIRLLNKVNAWTLEDYDPVRKVRFNVEYDSEIRKDVAKLQKYATENSASDEPSRLCQQVNICIMKAMRLLGTREHPSATGRREPLLLYLVGKPAAGKDTLLNFLAKAMYHYFKTVHKRPGTEGEYNQKAAKFAKPSSSDYWDGYYGQPTVVMSDIFCENNQDTKSKAAVDILHAVSSETFTLDMSAVEDKGKYNFTSPLIIATSNTQKEDFHLLGVSNFEAVASRIGLYATVERGSVNWTPDMELTPDLLDKCWTFNVSNASTSLRANKILKEGKYCLSDVLMAMIANFDKIGPPTITDAITEELDMGLYFDRLRTRDESRHVGGILTMQEARIKQQKALEYPQVGQLIFKAREIPIPKPGELIEIDAHAKVSPQYIQYFRQLKGLSGAFEHEPETADIISFCWLVQMGFKKKFTLRTPSEYLVFYRPKGKGAGVDIEPIHTSCTCYSNLYGSKQAKVANDIFVAFSQGRKPSDYGLGDFIDYYDDIHSGWWKVTHPSLIAKALTGLAVAATVVVGIVTGVAGYFSYIDNEAKVKHEEKIGKKSFLLPKVGVNVHSESKLEAVKARKGKEKFKKTVTGKGTKLVSGHMQRSSNLDPNVGILNKILGNIFQISYSMDGSYYECTAFCTFISGHTAVTVRHAAQHKKWKVVRLAPMCHNTKATGGIIEVRYSTVLKTWNEGCEEIYFTFGKEIGDQSNILKHVLDEKVDFTKISEVTRVATEGDIEGNYHLRFQDSGAIIRSSVNAQVRCNSNVVYKENFYVLSASGREGECGLPILAKHKNHLCMIGIYFGASKSKAGYFSPIRYLEEVRGDSYSQPISYVSEHIVAPPSNFIRGCGIGGKTDLFYKGTGPTDYVPSMLKKAWNKLSPDKPYPLPSGRMPVIREQVTYQFESGDKITISPWWKANATWVKTITPAMSPDLLEIMDKRPELLYGNILENINMDKEYKSLTIEEVLFGGDYTRQQDRSTSTGFFGLAHGIKDRKDLFSKETNFIHPKFKSAIEESIKMCEKGITPTFVNIQSLKDELLDIDDVENHKVRAFAVADLVQLVLLATTVGQAVYSIKSDALSPFVLGVNLHSIDASLLKKKMYRFANSGGKGAGDVKNMDGSVPPILIDFMAKFFNEFYLYERGTKEYNRLYAACRSILSVFWMRGSHLYKNCRGQGSGNWLTCIVNCFVLNVMHAFAFHLVHPELKFSEEISFGVHGDDSAWDSSFRVPFFNMINLEVIFKEYFGFIYTDPNKKSISSGYVSEEDYTFLSRTLVKFRGSYVGKLKESSILGMLEWMKKDHCDMQQLNQNCNAALREYLFYEEEIYNERRNFFLKMYRVLGFSNTLPTFEASLSRWGEEYSRASNLGCPAWLENYEGWEWMSL